MLYTIGRKDIYDRNFALNPQSRALKYGRGSVGKNGQPVKGGIVFRTMEEAEGRRNLVGADGHARYIIGIDAEWERDTYQIAGEPFRRLTRDAECWRLD